MVPRPQPSGGARPRLAGLGALPASPAGLRQALALGGLGRGQGAPSWPQGRSHDRSQTQGCPAGDLVGS